MKEIYLCRHGSTEYTQGGRPVGAEINIPLNESGKQQALKTGEYLRDYRGQFDIIYSSPMIRTLQTATIIGQVMNYQGQIIKDEMLIERIQGKMTSIHKNTALYRDIKKFKNSLYTKDPIANKLNEDDIYDAIENKFNLGKETDVALAKRCESFITTVINSPYNKILVVGHCSFLTCLLRTLFKVPHINYGDHCFLSYMIYDQSFKLITAPNTDHLKI